MIVVKIADIPIGINNRYSYVEDLMRDYITDEAPSFCIDVSDADISKERETFDQDCSFGCLEGVVIHRKIAERLADYDAVVLHGAVLDVAGYAYIFTARSGVGKTTHAKLWLSEIPGARILNGDKPVIRFIDGVPYAYGTPWRGKEGFGDNSRAELSSIAFLERAEHNTADVITPSHAAVRLVQQVYIPKIPSAAVKAMRIVDRILSSVRLVELRCNMNSDAAHVALDTMTK